MSNYDKIAIVYDKMMGSRSEGARLIIGILRKNHPKARTLLELACGTGAILKRLSKSYEVSGLDISAEMLRIARDEVPTAKLYRQSMADFSIRKKFDLIVAVFDSLNHLSKFSDWERVFRNSHRHLNEGGLMVFDINTEKKFKRVVSESPKVLDFKEGLALMHISAAGRGKTRWIIKVFKHLRGSTYRLLCADILEATFPAHRISESLKKIFSSVEIKDFEGKGERLYFVCRK